MNVLLKSTPGSMVSNSGIESAVAASRKTTAQGQGLRAMSEIRKFSLKFTIHNSLKSRSTDVVLYANEIMTCDKPYCNTYRLAFQKLVITREFECVGPENYFFASELIFSKICSLGNGYFVHQNASEV